MVNGVLALKYGLTDHFKGDGFQKLKLPADSPRGGVMTQSAFLSIGTMGNRTSPVIRGALVKEILLNDLPSPPPPNAGTGPCGHGPPGECAFARDPAPGEAVPLPRASTSSAWGWRTSALRALA